MMNTLFQWLKRITLLLFFVLLLALILRLIFFKGPVLTPTALPDTPIIDMHIHIAGLGYGNSGNFVSRQMKDSYKFDYYLNAFGLSHQDIKVNGDQIVVQQVAETVKASKHVKGAIVLAMDGVINEHGELDRAKTQVYIPNDFVAKQTAKYPSLFFGASINPYRTDALERLQEAKQQGATLIKWIPNIQHIDPADKRIIPFYKMMKSLGLPLLSHSGQEKSFDSAIDEYGDPKRLELPLSLGLTVIAAHIATTGKSANENNYQRILPMFDQYPNLYSEISSLTQLNKLGYMNKALEEPQVKGRLLYGSDYPLTNMILVSPYYFPLNLSFKQMRELSKIENPWDRDVALKQALGVPTEIFAKSASFFGLAEQ